MKLFIFFLLIYIMGFLTAIPIGATQIEIAKRSLNNHIGAAFQIVLGSVVSDVMYGAIAFFGIAPFLIDQTIIAIFWIVGAVILLALGLYTVIQSKKIHSLSINDKMLSNKQVSFVTGFSLAITNPMMIFWWLLGAQFVKDLNLISSFTLMHYAFFLFSGGLGLASYLTTLTLVLHWAKKFVSDRLMQRIYLAFGIVLLLIAFYFAGKSYNVFIKKENISFKQNTLFNKKVMNYNEEALFYEFH